MGYFSKEKAPEHMWPVIDEFNEKGIMGETSKSHKRRLKEGWFDKYAPSNKSGLDIGCGKDPLNDTFRRWDKILGDGDATDLDGIDGVFHTVYASHVLEHVRFPSRAVKRWYEVTSNIMQKSGGCFSK